MKSHIIYDSMGLMAERTRFLKESKEGVAFMCQIMEDIREEGREEGKRENALNMLKAGKLSIKEIVLYSGLSVEEIQKLQTEISAGGLL